CYFDGTYGQTCNDLRVIELAVEYGWNDRGNDFSCVEAENLLTKGEDDLMEDDLNILPDVAQNAEDYLNSLETRPFVSWQWYEGDFGLYANVESPQEDCEFVSSKSQEYPTDNYTGEWLHVNDHGNCTLY